MAQSANLLQDEQAALVNDRHVFKLSVGFAEFTEALTHIATVCHLDEHDLYARMFELQRSKHEFFAGLADLPNVSVAESVCWSVDTTR